ncbi:hypothetical protein [Aquabacterium sp.]|nr:hypothetical protein [Aquabacterium sp.]
MTEAIWRDTGGITLNAGVVNLFTQWRDVLCGLNDNSLISL